MGLDQYLTAKCYYSPMEWRPEEHRTRYSKIVEAVQAEDFVDAELPSVDVAVKVGYWRKSNQIHNWFVKNVQDNEDDCREYHVGRTQLVELRDLCRKVLHDHSLADDLLPARAGFFFGSTEYDEWYFGDLESTVAMIDRAVIKVPQDWDFYYQSSW
jgi:hypothetical protein